MKKIIFFILAFLCANSFANAEVCEWNDLNRYQNELSDFSYNLLHVDDLVDSNGDPLIGYFRFEFIGLASQYRVVVETKYGDLYSNEGSGIILNGGVYNLLIYNTYCDNPIKIVPVNVPYYKQYCGPNYTCEENADVWFDGTYENKGISENKSTEFKLNIRLVIVLISLMVIICAFVVFNAIRKRVPR